MLPTAHTLVGTEHPAGTCCGWASEALLPGGDPQAPAPAAYTCRPRGVWPALQTRESLLLPALRPPPSGTPLTTSFRPALRRLSVPRHHLKCARTRCPLLKTSPSSLLTQGPTAPGTVPLPSTPLQPHSDREPQRPATPPGAATSLSTRAGASPYPGAQVRWLREGSLGS